MMNTSSEATARGFPPRRRYLVARTYNAAFLVLPLTPNAPYRRLAAVRRGGGAKR
ncbi:MAG: hypothetical protein IJU19_01280 [Bacteroidales bacterium]|nr:hypothetical protein [Bacteroidales bacterium]